MTHALPRPKYLLNREIGFIAFNRRILELAEDPKVPVLERLRYLCIVSSNLDEFFEIRVAGLREQIKYKAAPGADGLPVKEVFNEVSRQTHDLVRHQYHLLNHKILPDLSQEGIVFFRRGDWTEAQRLWARDFFRREILPVLTPIGLDPSHPFPRILNKSLNFAIELEGRDAFGRESVNAVVQAPRALPRVIRLPEEVSGAPHGFVFLSSLLHAHVGELFLGMTVNGCHQFRLTRNSDLMLEEEEIKNLRTAVQSELSHRQFGDEVRLEVSEGCSHSMTKFLLKTFGLSDEDLYRVDGPVNLVRLNQVPEWVDRPDLKFPSFTQGRPKEFPLGGDLYAAIRKRDVLLHHPFQSFAPVVEFIQTAAQDPHVMAIRQTVYRAGTDSELIEALIRAAQQGKEVTVVIELMARFDEEANLNWAARLEQAGAHVVYGVVGYKTHAKMSMVVRREGNAIKRYVHIGTGNYHSSTTKFYTDFGLFTCQPEICSDINEVFLQITGLGQHAPLQRLLQSPFTLQSQLILAIQREADHAKAGRGGFIVAKMNSLEEPGIIQALYDASQAGVRIELIVRGICTLRPGIQGVSDHIRVRSIVGRFLEHPRIFYFRDDRAHSIWLSSADWMARNFFKRIEICVPVLDPAAKRRIMREGLRSYLRDNTQCWMMDKEGAYKRRTPGRGRPFSAQAFLLNEISVAPPSVSLMPTQHRLDTSPKIAESGQLLKKLKAR
jgi:polyphosphate kinase